jgi:hypothetical protein
VLLMALGNAPGTRPGPRLARLAVAVSLALSLILPTGTRAEPVAQTATCAAAEVLRVGRVGIHKEAGDSVFWYVAGLAVDADGSPWAYHPLDIGLDYLDNAGEPGDWWALATDTGESDGEPVIQGPEDPAPGYYVSTTALQDPGFDRSDPRRYVDATTVPFVVLPPRAVQMLGARLGDFALVIDVASGRQAPAIVADIGPGNSLGEGSVALADALGIPSDPRSGGTDGEVLYVIFPGSGVGRPQDLDVIRDTATHRFAEWPGANRLAACVPGLGAR